ncbi:PAS domain-containing sensor histidine kinase [Dyella monticola]|uniref:histidine kinase n=1 Tax=Dyella monticola TaxID=1927958 RepID=A0A370WSJ8_9GAMM|nr:PAS domain-containing sensor histidine kinase [Dyella monticola]RDS79138.1 PAS domain-containing sensor histidine kinase [Dyella monticola]
MVESMADCAIFMLDAKGRVANWNQGAERITGYQARDVIGRHAEYLYAQDVRDDGLPRSCLHIALADGHYEGECWWIRKNGQRFLAQLRIDPVRDEQGQLSGFVELVRDLKEREQAEDALRRSQEQFRLLVQSVTDYAIFMLDRHGRVASWNYGAERIKGYRPSEIIGKHFSVFYTQVDREKGEPHKNLSLATTEGRVESEGWRVRKDGSRFWAHVVIDRILDDHGELIGFAKITRDVTEQREAAAELDRAREALFQSQKTEAIGKLTGGVAHDFNNLLMVIQSCLDMVELKLPHESQLRRLVQNAQSAVQRGAALTQRMLAFARKQELRVAPVDVVSLVANMTDLLRRSLGPLITISTLFPAALNAVKTDANQLELALMNLVVNARDAMREGGNLTIAARNVTIDASHSTRLSPGEYVCLSVTDEGDGMDDETLAKATEPFFTTKGVGKGTGLGLSMVHGLAEQSGGRLVIKSSKGFGTRVEMWLPSVQADAMSLLQDSEIPPSVHPLHPSASLHIVVVDDDPLVLNATGAVLQDLGHRVIEAASAEEALHALENHTGVDMLITDHAMPGMTGAQLVGEVNIRWPALPVVLATGYAEIPTDLSDGATRLTKPYDRAGLALAINKAMEDRRVQV